MPFMPAFQLSSSAKLHQILPGVGQGGSLIQIPHQRDLGESSHSALMEHVPELVINNIVFIPSSNLRLEW